MISNFAAICSFFKFGMSPTKSVCYYLRFNEAETNRSEEHTSELQSRQYLVCRLLLEKKKKKQRKTKKNKNEYIKHVSYA